MKKRIISMALSLSMIFSVFASPLSAKAETSDNEVKGTTYYVSTLDGSDNNDGLSENKAFYSLQKINEIDLKPGDKVLLESGSVFINGFLHIKGSGSEEAPIVIDKYGEGNKPRIDTNGQGIWYQDYGKPLDSSSHKLRGYVSSSILLYDVEYINIRNLEITNKSLEIDAKYNYLQTMNRTGVAAVAQNKGTIDHIYLDGLNIHDVIGNVYDKHMNNGGIYFTVFKPINENETGISKYDDVKIENCIVNNVNRWGIAVGYTAYWDKFTGAEISDETIAKYGSTRVEIRNNYIKDAGGDAITTMYCDRPIIEYNVSDGVARQINATDYSETGSGKVAAAIWPWKCKDAIFQYNEAFDTCLNQDGQAWDADYGDGTIYQYNYSHNNGGGAVMICGEQAINTIFRYNISENDLAGVLNLPRNPKVDIYNNTFYMKEGVPFIRTGMTGGVAVVENNIIFNSGAKKNEEWTKGNSRVTYSNNLYYNYNNLPLDDKAAITEDPKFINGGNGPKSYTEITPSADKKITHELSAFGGYKLKDNSPAINAGKFIANNGGVDFFNNSVLGTPDIGAYESKVVSLELYSSVYGINKENLIISGVEKGIKVKDFLKSLSYDATLAIKNASGKVLGENDIITGGSKITLSTDAGTKVYTIEASEDNTIKNSIYMIKENGKILYVPSVENNPLKVQDVIQGISVHSSATVKIFNETEEVQSGNIADGMTLKVIAESGAENSYTINIKNNYQWALDYTGLQGNVWFAQKKANGEYTNLTTYDASYPQWNGNNYGGVGIDAPNKTTLPTEQTHGLLVDTLGTSGREQGHSMVYRVPKSGTIVLSVKDNEPYLRQTGNAGGKVKISFTHNGQEISSYELTQSLTKINIAPMTIEVQRGDFIRVEAQNIENPTKPSIHITPTVQYQNVKIRDTEAPTSPTQVVANNITKNSVDISWSQSSDNVGVTKYEVYNSETLIKTVNNVTSVNITDLISDTEYTISVKAFDESGNKSQAGTVTFRTIKEVDKTNLNNSLVIAKELFKEKYTEDSWASFTRVFDEAKTIFAKENATQEEVDNAKVLLYKAIEDLKEIVIVKSDKALLSAAIEYAEAEKAKDEFKKVIPLVASKFVITLNEAKAILADKSATQEQVDNISDKLITLIHMLGFTKGDKSQLTALVNIINALDSSKYTTSTWTSLQAELAKVNVVLADENAMEKEVQEAYSELNSAYNKLKSIIVIDDSIKENLKVKIEEIKAGQDNVIDIPLTENPNFIEVSINDVNGLLQNTGSISLNIKDFATVKIPSKAFNGQIAEEVEKIVFRMDVIKNLDILKDLKAVSKVYEFNIVAVKGNEERKISQFGEGIVEVKLTLTDADLEGLNKGNLVVLYYNEETKKFEYVETILNGNEVTFKTSHFSKFIIAEKEVVNKDKLIKLVEAIEKLPSSEYIASTWSKLNAELEKANEVIVDNNVTKEQVEEVYSKLIKTYLDLRLIPNKAKLLELINKAETIDTDKYTEVSVSKLKAKLSVVKTVLSNEEVDQREVDDAEKTLEASLKELVLLNDDTSKQNNNGGNVNSGNNTSGSGTTGSDNSGSSNSRSSNSVNSTNNKLSGKDLLPTTGGVDPFSVATISIISILLGLVILKKKR